MEFHCRVKRQVNFPEWLNIIEKNSNLILQNIKKSLNLNAHTLGCHPPQTKQLKLSEHTVPQEKYFSTALIEMVTHQSDN